MKDLIAALRFGTTRPVALIIGLMSVMQAMALWLQTGSWLSHESFIALLQVFPLNTWAGFYAISGLLIIWRVLEDNSKPIIAWLVNIWTAFFWCLPVALKIVYIGFENVFSPNTVIAAAACWLLFRTEATPRDTRVA